MVLAMDGFRCGARRMGIPMLMRATLSASGISVTADISSERGGDACNAQGAIISILRTIGEASLYRWVAEATRRRTFGQLVASQTQSPIRRKPRELQPDLRFTPVSDTISWRRNTISCDIDMQQVQR